MIKHRLVQGPLRRMSSFTFSGFIFTPLFGQDFTLNYDKTQLCVCITLNIQVVGRSKSFNIVLSTGLSLLRYASIRGSNISLEWTQTSLWWIYMIFKKIHMCESAYWRLSLRMLGFIWPDKRLLVNLSLKLQLLCWTEKQQQANDDFKECRSHGVTSSCNVRHYHVCLQSYKNKEKKQQ